MKPWIAIAVAFVLWGCSKATQNPSSQAQKPPTQSETSAGQAQPTGISDAEFADLASGKKWDRINKVDKMDGSQKEVEFTFLSQPIGDTPITDLPLFLLACSKSSKEIIIAARTGATDSGKVRLRFGEGSIQVQDWLKGSDTLYSRQPKPLLKQILATETFKFEFTPVNHSARTYEIRVLNLKELLEREPLCKK